MTEETDQKVESFMQRVAVAYGRNEPAPDPGLLWLRARLERRTERERKVLTARQFSFSLIVVALLITGYVGLQVTAPVLAGIGIVGTATAATVAGVALIVWFVGIRPLFRPD